MDRLESLVGGKTDISWLWVKYGGGVGNGVKEDLEISGKWVDCGVLNQYRKPWKRSRLGGEEGDNEFDFGLLSLKGL